jgi:hypothetical protein
MDRFKNYLDKIRADDELKETTKDHVTKYAFEKEMKKNRRKVLNMKKTFVTAAAVAICAVIGFFGYTLYNTPVNYISLDINPSVEIGLNYFDKVVSIEGMNEDGEYLINGLELKRMSVQEAVRTLVEQASRNEYISGDGSTVIALTAGSNDEQKAEKLQQRSEEGVNKALQDGNISAIVYTNCSDLALRNEAKEAGVSPGKFKLIKTLQSLEPEVEIDSLIDTKVAEIMMRTKEALKAYNYEEDDTETGKELEQIRNTANRVEEAKGFTYEEQNRNIEKEQNQSTETQNREQEQNQTQPTSKEATQQEQNQNQGTETQNKEQEQNQPTSSGQKEQNGSSQTQGSGSGR